MYDATADNRGTLQQLAEELDNANQDGTSLGRHDVIWARVLIARIQIMYRLHSARAQPRKGLRHLFTSR